MSRIGVMTATVETAITDNVVEGSQSALDDQSRYKEAMEKVRGENVATEIALRMGNLARRAQAAMTIAEKGVCASGTGDFLRFHGVEFPLGGEQVQKVQAVASLAEGGDPRPYLEDQFYHNRVGPGVVLSSSGFQEGGIEAMQQIAGQAIDALAQCLQSGVEVDDSQIAVIANDYVRGMLGRVYR